jgi:hypothetical protein
MWVCYRGQSGKVEVRLRDASRPTTYSCEQLVNVQQGVPTPIHADGSTPTSSFSAEVRAPVPRAPLVEYLPVERVESLHPTLDIGGKDHFG